jgi:uncharacterized surface protein with fasciclin (FAS1) repeats
MEALERDGRFKQLGKMLKNTGMDSYLKSDQPYTLFAPVDKAFGKLPADVRKAIVDGDDSGSRLAMGFVIKGNYGIISFTNGVSPIGKPLTHKLNTFSETFITTVSEKGELTVNGAKVLGEIYAANGTIIVVDKVIPVVMSAPAKSGLTRVLPKNLLKWGLGQYVLPAQRSDGID